MQSIIKNEFNKHIKASQETMQSAGKLIEIAANICIDSLKNGNKILIFGNGGSAADGLRYFLVPVDFCCNRIRCAAPDNIKRDYVRIHLREINVVIDG